MGAMTASGNADFLQQAEACFRRILAALDRFDPDGKNCVLNRQAAANQLWLAEGASAWHFAMAEDGQWLDTKGRGPLPQVLADVLSRRLGRRVVV
jgi:frataxin-like iron-binding protein CyaY